MTFRKYAKCMHCGCDLDVFADDADGESDCVDYDGFVGVHDYDTEFPMGVDDEGNEI